MAGLCFCDIQLLLLVISTPAMSASSHPNQSEVLRNWDFINVSLSHTRRALPPRNFTLDNGTASTYDVQLEFLPQANMLNGFRQYYCYVNVKVFKSSAMKYPANNVSVFALINDPMIPDKYFIGYTKAVTDLNGNACVRTVCRKNAVIFADSGVERLNLACVQQTPKQLNSTPLSFTEILLTNIKEIPNFFDPPGPIYTQGYFPECKTPQPLAYFIGFHFLGPPDKLESNPNASKYSYEESWYPLREGEPGYKVCYIKIKVKTPIYNVTIIVESYNDQNNYYYGRMISGPKEDPTGGNVENRAACIEYRCPYENPSNGDVLSTRLDGAIIVPPLVSCVESNVSKDFQSNKFNITNSNFEISLSPFDDYGPNAGIYFHQNKKIAKSLCFTGATDLVSNYEMNPDTGYAFQFTCTPNMQPGINLIG